MANTIFFNGRTTAIPGSYSEVDATGLAGVGLASTGIVAILAEAEGGSPYNGATPIHRITSPGAVGRTFREGDMVEASAIAFDPARDDNIPGGAVELRCLKVNPATRSTVTLLDAAASDSMVITSIDYGLFTTQINVDVSAGTNKGKKYTIVLNDTTETFDDVGGDTVWTTTFTQGTNALTTMTIALDNSTGVTAAWTEANAGLDGDISNDSLAEVARVVSANAGDTTQTITLYGLDASGDPQTETLTLNGTTHVVGTATWAAGGILGAILSAATAGNITIDNSPTTGTNVIVITAATLTAGVVLLDNASVMLGQVLTVTAGSSPGGTRDIIAFGFAGQTAIGEKIQVSSTTPVAGTTTTWTDVTVLVLGDGDAGVTWTLSSNAIVLPPAGYDTVQKVVDYINDVPGWAASIPGISGSSPGTLLIANLDEKTATDATSAVNFTGDLAFGVQKLNDESSLVSAAVASGANAVPDNTSVPIYLAGGVEGTTAFANWQAALDLLRDEEVSTIVPITSDAAVHAAAVAHCIYMAGAGAKERDMVVGGASGVTKANAKSAVIALNSRHARYCFQDIDRYNTDGVREVFAPSFLAAAVAGAQAGSPVGESLTFKYFNALDVTQESTFVLADDANDLIQSGMWFLERVDGIGYRNTRNVTTYLVDNNRAYVEASVNEAVNFAVKNIRTNLEAKVGQKGFQATVNQAVSIVVQTLSQLIEDEIITTWRNLVITLSGDVMEVDVELAPVEPINFIKTTVHLVSAEFAAAA